MDPKAAKRSGQRTVCGFDIVDNGSFKEDKAPGKVVRVRTIGRLGLETSAPVGPRQRHLVSKKNNGGRGRTRIRRGQSTQTVK